LVADAWGAAFLGSAEPWKLSFQNPAGLGRGLGQRRDSGSGLWGQLGLRLLTGAPVARLRFAAAGADAPQLLGGLIKEEVGVVGHGCSFARPFIPWLGPKGKPSAPLYDAFLPRVFKEMGPEPSRDAVRPITLRGNNAERSARGSLVSTDRTICVRKPGEDTLPAFEEQLVASVPRGTTTVARCGTVSGGVAI